MPTQTITLTTDFGTVDGYVGALKGVLATLAPSARLVDLSHDLGAGDIRATANLLRRAIPYFPAHTVHLVVVDPEVGSKRAILGIEHPRGKLVGPDNGCLDPFFDAGVAVELEREDLYLDAPGETFHGRDRMAPAAAALATDYKVEDLGRSARQPVRLQPLPLERRDDRVLGSIEHIDRFGNVITNIPWSWIEELPPKACAWIAERPVCRRVGHYAQLPGGRPGFLCGSEGTLELAFNQASLADAWRLAVGEPVRVQAGGKPKD